MRAAYYEKNGSAREVLRVGEIPTPQAGPGEVRVKLAASGVNPSDVKGRQGSRKIAWPQLVPHSDGAGVIDQVGDGVAKSRLGERVWVWNGQWKRPFGTAAEHIALPAAMAVPSAAMPASVTVTSRFYNRWKRNSRHRDEREQALYDHSHSSSRRRPTRTRLSERSMRPAGQRLHSDYYGAVSKRNGPEISPRPVLSHTSESPI